MRLLDDYRARIIRLDRQLQAVFTADATDHTRVETLQKELQDIKDRYDSQELGRYFFKVYELEAYMHFLTGDLPSAQRLLADAIRTRGNNYLDAERLKYAIYAQKRRRNALVRMKHKGAAKKRIYEGIAWLAVGLALTGLIYVFDIQTAYHHALNNEEASYSFNYAALTGTVAIGGLLILKGSFDLATASRRSRAAIRRLDRTEL